MAINLASKASPKLLERFTKESVTEGIFSNEYDWTGVETVRVYTLDSLPLNDYDRTKVDGSSRFGALTEVGDTYQEMTVKDDKAFNGVIDKGNNTSQLQIKAAGKILKMQSREVLIPYADKYRLKVIANGAGLGTVNSTALTKTTILEAIFKANAAMSNALIPMNNRVLYIGETASINLKLADQLIGIDKLGEKSIVNGVCGKINGCQVRIVPDVYLPTGVVFMIVHKGIGCAPKKIETMRVLTDQYIVDGSILQGRMLHDCFVFGTKANGIYVYATAGCTTPTITVASGKATITGASGETIKYTLDGTDPKTSPVAEVYSAAVTVASGDKVRAYAYKTGSLNSGVAAADVD
jgi:hypothetical protein